MASTIASRAGQRLGGDAYDCPASPPVDEDDFSSTIRPDAASDVASTKTATAPTRILVTGRRNTGKTTLLRRLCATSYTNGANELRVDLSQGSCLFYDSVAIHDAQDNSVTALKNFLRSKATARTLPEQLHAIWYCISADDELYIPRGDETFFSANIAQNVPVIVVFTKYDALVTVAFAELRRTMGRLEAKEKRFVQAQELLQSQYIDRLKSFPFPPAAFVRMDDLRSDTLNTDTLIETTLDVASGALLAPILQSVRQNNIDSCSEDAVAGAIDAKDAAGKARSDFSQKTLNVIQKLYPLCCDVTRTSPYHGNTKFVLSRVGLLRLIFDDRNRSRESLRSYLHLQPQTVADCTSMLCAKIPAENAWTNARRAEAIAGTALPSFAIWTLTLGASTAACICVDQTFIEGSATVADFPTAFKNALDAYFSTDRSPRSVVNKEITKFSPHDYREVADPTAAEPQATRKAIPKLVEIIKAHRLRLDHE
uniref:G domain-containing protein n=1 Tax=Mycena chlorophos TaxID=658473 RepID=A0ABQ0L7S9_MYCCL|nr:predicted protein [Mycena chlorophos]